MTDKKLNEEQLEKVSGGTTFPGQNTMFILGQKIEPNAIEQFIGRDVIIYDVGGSSYTIDSYGTIMRAYDGSFGCGTRKTVDLRLHPNCSSRAKKTSEGYAIRYVDLDPVYLIEKYLK